MIYALLGLGGVSVLAIVVGQWMWTRRSRQAGRDEERSQAQKEIIDEQAKVNAARVATADPSTGRAERLRDRFTRE